MFGKYIILLCGFISNKISYDLHTTKPIHLRYHLDNQPHGALLGHQSFTYLYPILIGCVFVVDFVPKLSFKKIVEMFTISALFILPIIQVISWVLYTVWYYYEPPLPIIPAGFFFVAGILHTSQPSKGKKTTKNLNTDDIDISKINEMRF